MPVWILNFDYFKFCLDIMCIFLVTVNCLFCVLKMIVTYASVSTCGWLGEVTLVCKWTSLLSWVSTRYVSVIFYFFLPFLMGEGKQGKQVGDRQLPGKRCSELWKVEGYKPTRGIFFFSLSFSFSFPLFPFCYFFKFWLSKLLFHPVILVH